MSQTSHSMLPHLTIGLDLGDKVSRWYALARDERSGTSGAMPTTLAGLNRHFGDREPCRVVLEVGTHSPWVSRALAAMGHEVIVSNPSATYGPRRRRKRNDHLDAEYLARQGRADPALLHPIQHRGPEAQQHLELVRARDQVVGARTKLINHVRGAVKSLGGRLARCSAEAFATRATTEIPAELRGAITPLLELIAELTQRIKQYDQQVRRIIARHYPEVERLQQPAGVGPLTALAFVLLVETPRRFAKSVDVGAYFGLVPRLDDSSDSHPQLRISKAGDALGRRLLVSAAQYILGPFGPPCDLRRHGEKIAARGGKNAKKRAAVAVARKLAVLLHRLWCSDQPYNPDYLQQRHAA